MMRRTTLGPLDNQMNSSLPLPSANYQGQQQQQRSLGLGRTSLASSSQPLMSAGRQSLGRPSMGPAVRKSNVNNGLAFDMNSMSIQENLGRASIGGRPSSMMPRRSSAYGGGGVGRQSTAGGSGMGTAGLKDPRSIRDKQWQLTAIRSLVKFVMEAGYDHTISPKILSAPSIKDFQNLFMFLYNHLDPGYQWNKKFEDDVLMLAKCLKYPFADQITKSTLQAVGSLHAWPFLLAFLVWIVELIIICDSLDGEIEDAEQQEKDPDRMFTAFLINGYEQFMTGQTDYEHLEIELQDKFRESQQDLLANIEAYQAENETLEGEYESLSSEPSPLVQLDAKRSEVASDIGKVKQWIDTLGQKKRHLTEQLEQVQIELNSIAADLEASNADRNKLQTIVDAQEISPADVDRMNSEKDQLTRGIEQLTEKNEDLTKQNWTFEMDSQKRFDVIEKLVHEYNGKSYRLDLIPASAVNANGINFELSLNPHATRADQILSADLRGPIKTEDQRAGQREEFDKLMECVNEKLDDIAQVEGKVTRWQEQYEHDKNDAAAEFDAMASEIDTLDREIRRVKIERSRGIFDCQREVRELEIEYDNLQRRLADLKERHSKQAAMIMEEVKTFVKQITGPLADLKMILEGDLASMRSEYETEIVASAVSGVPAGLLDDPDVSCIADTSFYAGKSNNFLLDDD